MVEGDHYLQCSAEKSCTFFQANGIVGFTGLNRFS
jgi:hypothetical protein